MIAHLAHEYHIAPSVLLNESEAMLNTMLAYHRWVVKQANRKRR